MKAVIRNASWIIVLMLGSINLVRGLAHLLTQDSAAGAAGIAVNHAGGADIIYLFAIIGGVQAIVALFYVYVAIFNRNLLPLALLIESSKTGLNLWIGYYFKPSQAEVVVGSSQDALQLALSLSALAILGLTGKAKKGQRRIGLEK